MNKNKLFLICFLVLLVVFPSGDRNVPDLFRRAPTVYFGSQVVLAVGFFTSFMGLTTSGPRGQRFTRFCTLYSGLCLGLFIILVFIIAFLSEFEIPFSLSNRVYAALICFTRPFLLFVLLLLLALPLPLL